MASTYPVRIGSARGVDCRCFCCFAREKTFSPTRWRPLLGLFQLKTYTEAMLGHAKHNYRPHPITDLGSGRIPPKNSTLALATDDEA